MFSALPSSSASNRYTAEALAKSLKFWQRKLGYEEQAAFARFLNIAPAYLSEIFSGQKSGMRKVFDFADRLGITVDELFSVRITLRIVGEIMNDQAFSMHEQDDSLGRVDISELPGVTRDLIEKGEAFKVVGPGLLPIFKDGDILITERNSHKKLISGDTVVYHDGRQGTLRFYEECDDHIVLKTILAPRKSQDLGKRMAKLCCKVVLVIHA